MKYDVSVELRAKLEDKKNMKENIAHLTELLSGIVKYPGQLKFSFNDGYITIEINTKDYKGTVSFYEERDAKLDINIVGYNLMVKNNGDNGYTIGMIYEGDSEVKDGYYEVQVAKSDSTRVKVDYFDSESLEYLKNQNNGKNIGIDSYAFSQLGIVPDAHDYYHGAYPNQQYLTIASILNNKEYVVLPVQERLDKMKR